MCDLGFEPESRLASSYRPVFSVLPCPAWAELYCTYVFAWTLASLYVPLPASGAMLNYRRYNVTHWGSISLMTSLLAYDFFGLDVFRCVAMLCLSLRPIRQRELQGQAQRLLVDCVCSWMALIMTLVQIVQVRKYSTPSQSCLVVSVRPARANTCTTSSIYIIHIIHII